MIDRELHASIIATHGRRHAQRLSLIVRDSTSTLAAVIAAGQELQELGCEITLVALDQPEHLDIATLREFIAVTWRDAVERAHAMARTERLTSGAVIH